MIKQRLVLSALLAGTVATFLIPAAIADPVKKATEVTFGQPVEIPGMVLLPGTYVIKIPDPYTHGDMVGFYDRNESHLYKLVRTIPAYRIQPTANTVITLEERAGNAPQAINQWFYPGDYWGKEFVYGKAVALTASTQAPAPALPAPAPAPVAAEPAPAPAPVAEAAPEPEAPAPPVEIAQATPPPAPAPAPAAPAQELPQTASFMPLIGLLGVSSLAVGGLLKWLPKRGPGL